MEKSSKLLEIFYTSVISKYKGLWSGIYCWRWIIYIRYEKQRP